MPPAAEYDAAGYDPLPYLIDLEAAIGEMRETDSGSNNWALSGSRTASGKPLMAGDPHRGLDTPNVYYQNHVACPEFDAVGLSFPGFPAFPHFGHNASVAWCVTHAVADYQDLYVERFRNGPPLQCQYGDSWDDVEVRREALSVRGGDEVEIDVVVTRHGPVIAGDPESGHGIAFRYTSTDGPNPDGAVPAAHAEGGRRRRARRGAARLGRPLQQLRLHRRPRQHPVPEQGAAAGTQHGERVAARAGMVGRVRVAGLRAVR